MGSTNNGRNLVHSKCSVKLAIIICSKTTFAKEKKYKVQLNHLVNQLLKKNWEEEVKTIAWDPLTRESRFYFVHS